MNTYNRSYRKYRKASKYESLDSANTALREHSHETGWDSSQLPDGEYSWDRLPDEEELDASVDNIGTSGKHVDPVRLYLRRSTGASSTRARLVSQPLCRYATGLVHVNSLSWTCYSAYRVEANIQLRTV